MHCCPKRLRVHKSSQPSPFTCVCLRSSTFLQFQSPIASFGKSLPPPPTMAATPSPYLKQPIRKVDLTQGQGIRYTYAVGNCQGWRTTQEDAHLAIPNFDTNTSLFGVFDGHHGPEVARYIAHHFADYLKKNSSYKAGQVERGIQETFMLLDEAILTKEGNEELVKYRCEAAAGTKAVDGQEEVALLTGCTGVVLLIKNDVYYCANVGDSRCLLAREGTALQLSKDHKPTEAEEEARIRNAGGTVINGRICRIIDISRAFGDHAFKRNPKLNAKEQMIVAWPYTVLEPAKLKSDPFLVLICDGIWNAMGNQEVVEFIKRRLPEKSLSLICEELLKHILPDKFPPADTIAGKDNMTVMIIKTGPAKPKSKDSSTKVHSKESQKSRKSQERKGSKICAIKSKDVSKTSKKKSK